MGLSGIVVGGRERKRRLKETGNHVITIMVLKIGVTQRIGKAGYSESFFMSLRLALQRAAAPRPGLVSSIRIQRFTDLLLTPDMDTNSLSFV